MKSTIGNITLINNFRKKNDDLEASPEGKVLFFVFNIFVDFVSLNFEREYTIIFSDFSVLDGVHFRSY